jgi:hypothetical protein
METWAQHRKALELLLPHLCTYCQTIMPCQCPAQELALPREMAEVDVLQ